MFGTSDQEFRGELARESSTKLPLLTGSCDVDKSGPRTYRRDVEKSTREVAGGGPDITHT
jgi:hypothetical protein